MRRTWIFLVTGLTRLIWRYIARHTITMLGTSNQAPERVGYVLTSRYFPTRLLFSDTFAAKETLGL